MIISGVQLAIRFATGPASVRHSSTRMRCDTGASKSAGQRASGAGGHVMIIAVTGHVALCTGRQLRRVLR